MGGLFVEVGDTLPENFMALRHVSDVVSVPQGVMRKG